MLSEIHANSDTKYAILETRMLLHDVESAARRVLEATCLRLSESFKPNPNLNPNLSPNLNPNLSPNLNPNPNWRRHVYE